MSQVSVINIEETIGKTVGHRLTPRGVFRFKTHEETYLISRAS